MQSLNERKEREGAVREGVGEHASYRQKKERVNRASHRRGVFLWGEERNHFVVKKRTPVLSKVGPSHPAVHGAT